MRQKNSSGDDIRAWSTEMKKESGRTNSSKRPSEYKAANPGKPIPPERQGADKCEGVPGDIEPPPSIIVVLEKKIDEMLEEDDRAKGGGKISEMRLQELRIMKELLSKNPNISIENAASKALDMMYEEDGNFELHEDQVGALMRAYFRCHRKALIDRIGQAIADDDEQTALPLIAEFLQREKKAPKRRGSKPKK